MCPGPPSGVSLPLCGRGSGASQVSGSVGAGEDECVCGTRTAAGPGELRVGAAPPFPGPRQEARRPAARPNRLGGLPPAGLPPARLPPAGLPGRSPGRRARAGPRRCLGPGQVRVGGGTRLSPSPWPPRPPPRLLRRGEGRFWRSSGKRSPGRRWDPRESESKQ